MGWDRIEVWFVGVLTDMNVGSVRGVRGWQEGSITTEKRTSTHKSHSPAVEVQSQVSMNRPNKYAYTIYTP